MERFENIIVGSGIAGLICGGYLAQAGQSTLILERKHEIGGRIRDYEFDGFRGAIQGPTWHSTWDGGFWPRAAQDLNANIRFVTFHEAAIWLKAWEDRLNSSLDAPRLPP